MTPRLPTLKAREVLAALKKTVGSFTKPSAPIINLNTLINKARSLFQYTPAISRAGFYFASCVRRA